MKLFSQDLRHYVYCFKLAQKRLLAGRLYIYGRPEYIHPGFIPIFVYGQDVKEFLNKLKAPKRLKTAFYQPISAGNQVARTGNLNRIASAMSCIKTKGRAPR